MRRTEVKRFTSKMLGANCYIVYSDKDCFIIDPCVKPEIIDSFINEKQLNPAIVLVTHSHIDHILYINEIRELYNIKAAVHEEDFNELIENDSNGSSLFGLRKELRKPEKIIRDGEVIKAGDMFLHVISTPGHTPGSVCFYIDNMLFSGDTLFYLSIGRTDLGRGCQKDLNDSINNKLFSLDEKTIVYPGHGTFTSIEFEKKENPYVIKL